MSPSRPFILRPVATTLLMVGILLVGFVAYRQLPISALPQVAQARTLSNLVPGDQDEKLELIRHAAEAVDESLNPSELQKAPTDQEK